MMRRQPPTTRSVAPKMNATTYEMRTEGWEPYDGQADQGQLPRRPRRQFFNKRTAALAAVLTCAAGFYAGVRVEKGQLSSSGTSLTFPTAATGGATAGRGTGGSGAAGARAAGGLANLFGGGGPGAGGGGGAGATFGTISSVSGKSLLVTEAGGNVVKVTLSSSTAITKSLGVKRSSLHPGDTVVIRGLQGSHRGVVATSVSDSGSSASGAGGGTRSGASSSALSSLFSSNGSGG